jgi:hypothetical protein
MKALDKRAQVGGVTTMIIAIVVGAVLFMIGIYINSKVASSINTNSFSAAENTTFANVKTNVLAGFDLGTIVFIVLAASVIIGVVIGMTR